MKILKCVINESLRLMPPVPALARTLLKEDVIGGCAVEAGATAVLQPWITQRDERFWPEALRFKPERFLARPERKDDYTFFPFAKGARSCIGEDLALSEARLILAMLVEEFEWKVRQDFVPVPVHHLTLKSRNGMWMELRKRKTIA